MRLRITTAMTALAALVGLAGCSMSTTNASAPATTAPASAPADNGSSQSVTSACTELSGPMAQASEALQKVATEAATDPTKVVAVFDELVKAYQSAADKVTNAEVKKAMSDVVNDVTAVRDATKKVYVDKDMSAMAAMSTATQKMQTSLTALTTLCTKG